MSPTYTDVFVKRFSARNRALISARGEEAQPIGRIGPLNLKARPVRATCGRRLYSLKNQLSGTIPIPATWDQPRCRLEHRAHARRARLSVHQIKDVQRRRLGQSFAS